MPTRNISNGVNKQKVKYVVDLITMISFLITAISGLAIKFFMPSGVRQGRLQEFMGIQKGNWSAVHDFFGIIMIIAVIFHIIFYWNVFVCMTRNFFKPTNCELKESEIKENEE